MKHIGLFEGIGGFSLGAHEAGVETVLTCEISDFQNTVLQYHFPSAIHHRDIYDLNYGTIEPQLRERFGANWREDGLILTGGFPCQPFSLAGNRKGTSDDRYLWPEMLRVIREFKPVAVVGENVTGILNMGEREVFARVEGATVVRYDDIVQAEKDYIRQVELLVPNIIKDLEESGYSVQVFAVPASSVGAPRRRERVWFVAYSESNGSSRASNKTSRAAQGQDGKPVKQFKQRGKIRVAPNTSSVERERSKQHRSFRGEGTAEGKGGQFSGSICGSWREFPTQSPIRKRNDGISSKLLRFMVNDFYETISHTSQENRIKNLPEVWKRVQSEEVWQQVRRLYSLESKEVLQQVMQLYSETFVQQEFVSPFGEKLCKPIMQVLRKHGQFRCSPQGRELEKQRSEQFGNSLSFLPHEVALAAKRFEAAIAKFETWHNKESIKAYGNAVVPLIPAIFIKSIVDYHEELLKARL